MESLLLVERIGVYNGSIQNSTLRTSVRARGTTSALERRGELDLAAICRLNKLQRSTTVTLVST